MVWPASSLTPFFSAASTIASASVQLIAIGFSTTMCLPWLAARMVCSAWKRFGLDTHTASTSGSRHNASAES